MPDFRTLHLCHADEKFIPSFIRFVTERVDGQYQRYYLMGYVNPATVTLGPNVRRIRGIASKLRMLWDMNRAEKIALHGAFIRPFLFWSVALQPWLLKKCYWLVWGGDLYAYRKPRTRWKEKAFERVRAFVIRRFGYLVTSSRGDYELAVQWYGAGGEWVKCFNYTSNLYKPPPQQAEEPQDGIIRILAGNSSNLSNRHDVIFEQLLPYRDQPIEIYCPLSYSDKANALKVSEQGKVLFGDKFIPLMDFLPLENYCRLIARIDIALFAHKRQQALGNSITLLGMGKKLYIDPDSTLKQVFDDHGFRTFALSDFRLEPLSATDAEHNRQAAITHFSEEALQRSIASWAC